MAPNAWTHGAIELQGVPDPLLHRGFRILQSPARLEGCEARDVRDRSVRECTEVSKDSSILRSISALIETRFVVAAAMTFS